MLALLFNILKQSLLKMLKSGPDLTCFSRALNKFAIVSWNVPLTKEICNSRALLEHNVC